ncbi:MAG: hypothetical protein ABEJ31_06795 [Haloarculaceae archaeon]
MASKSASRRSTGESQPPATDADGDRDGLGRAVGLGARGGLVATVAMTAFRMPISESPPPTGALWAKVLGGEPDDHHVLNLVLHLLYGMGAATAFAAWFQGRVTGRTVTDERRGVAAGALYGLGLSAFGSRVILGRLLGMDLQSDERFVFAVGHLIYGITLGAWLGSNA